MNTATTETVDAIDAYDLATYAREHGKWLAALMRSITLDKSTTKGATLPSSAAWGSSWQTI